MLKGPLTLDDLIELVNHRAENGHGHARLTEASVLSQELNSLTDQLLDYFVQQAREAGMSWSQIGQQLGVTKQGAQQRFTGQSRLEDLPHQLRELGASLEEKFLARSPSASGGLLQKVRSAFKPQRFTAAARQVVILAQEEARGLSHDRIGAEHVLLGLLREESGVAAATLRSVGVTLEQVRNKVAEKVPASGESSSGHLPFATGARTALESAMTESANLRHNYIGTEHVLLGVLKEDNMARDVLKELNMDVDHLTEEVSRLLERL
ncbi:MAG TPA: Clp protease N-terminal domain-containing protein [Actinomycetota bacterium]|nr:Clp protease N-terminal domain-containing protein [Actinomycetota bacterium]